MRSLKILAAAAILTTTAATADAGGLAPPVIPEPVVIVDEPVAPTGTINSGYIVLGLLAALVAASASF